MQDKEEEVLLCIRPSIGGWCVFSQVPLSSPLTHCPPTMLVIHGPRQRPLLPGTRCNGNFSILHYPRFPPVLSHYSPDVPAAEPAFTSVPISITRRNPRLFLPSEFLKLQLTRRGRIYCISIPLPMPHEARYYSSSKVCTQLEAVVEKKFSFALDYGKEWDYINN